MELQFIEKTIRGWMREEIPLKTILLAIHNVSAHGTDIPEDPSSEELENLFKGYDICLNSLPD